MSSTTTKAVASATVETHKAVGVITVTLDCPLNKPAEKCRHYDESTGAVTQPDDRDRSRASATLATGRRIVAALLDAGLIGESWKGGTKPSRYKVSRLPDRFPSARTSEALARNAGTHQFRLTPKSGVTLDQLAAAAKKVAADFSASVPTKSGAKGKGARKGKGKGANADTAKASAKA